MEHKGKLFLSSVHQIEIYLYNINFISSFHLHLDLLSDLSPISLLINILENAIFGADRLLTLVYVCKLDWLY